MRKLLALMLALVMCFALVGCGKSQSTATAPAEAAPAQAPAEAAPAQEPVEIEFIQWWASEGGGEYLNGLVERFEAENPNIKVNLTTLPFGDVKTQVVASQATGMVPDIIGMNPPWTREFYDLGILEPLDDYIAADSSFDISKHFQASFSKIDGHSYLAPVDCTAFFLFYNKDMFEAAGIEPPTTWQEIIDSAVAITNKDKNQYGITFTMSETEAANGSILNFYPMLYALNGRTFVDGKYVANSDEMLTSFTLLRDLYESGSILPGTTTRSEAQTVEEFAAGNAGMMISHNGHILTVANRNPDLNYGIIPIPSYDGKGTPDLRHHGWDVGISATSSHKEEAWKFISYMLSEENLTEMCNEMLKVPAMYGVEVDYLDEYPVISEAIDYMNDLTMVEELMMMPKASACWVELTKAGSAVLQGVMTPEEATEAVQTAWDSILEQ